MGEIIYRSIFTLLVSDIDMELTLTLIMKESEIVYVFKCAMSYFLQTGMLFSPSRKKSEKNHDLHN
jgi:hypothetical protein